MRLRRRSEEAVGAANICGSLQSITYLIIYH